MREWTSRASHAGVPEVKKRRSLHNGEGNFVNVTETGNFGTSLYEGRWWKKSHWTFSIANVNFSNGIFERRGILK